MSDVRFENQGEEYGAPPQESSGFDLTGTMVQWGLVPSRTEAQYVLIGIAIVAFFVAVFFLFTSIGGHSTPPLPPAYDASGTNINQ